MCSHLTAAVAMAGATAGAAPIVVWHSDPLAPGETALLVGEGLVADCRVEIARLNDASPTAGSPTAFPKGARSCSVLQPRGPSLKFTVPEGLQPGILACRVGDGKGWSPTFLLNGPTAWWVQGDQGTSASPGGWVRVQGKCLSLPGGKAKMRLKGSATVELPATGDGYSLRAALPPNLAEGDYEVATHNGYGGAAAWSEPLQVRVAHAPNWPGKVYDVRDLGAAGDGLQDDSAAIAAALQRLGAEGGGTLYFPRGRYLVTQTLTIPENVSLKGESRELCMILWPDQTEPLADMLVGTRRFVLENLTFGMSNHGNFLRTELGRPDSGDVCLRRVRVLANRYRGHIYQEPEEMSRRFTRFSVHGAKLLMLGGENVEVTDSDFLASGCALYLTGARGALIRGNRFRMGRFGWYWLSGSDGVIVEDNEFLGADLSTWGGGINNLDGSSASQHVYFARNRLAFYYGGDHEALTSDGSGSAYFGKLSGVEGTKASLAGPANWGQKDWTGCGVFVLAGRGAGQYRLLRSYEGQQIEVDRPWTIALDETSTVSITNLQRRLLLIGNDFEEVGVAIQFYGTSVECIAEGNRCRRGLGFINHGMNYYGNQPSWYVQWLRNEIGEGNSYGNAYFSNAASAIDVTAHPPSGDAPCLLTVGTIVRGNKLRSNACISLGAGNPPNPVRQCPWLADVIVEKNEVTNSDFGVVVADGVEGVLLRGNRCRSVVRPEVTGARIRQEQVARRQKLAGARDPIAHWSFDALKEGRVPDQTGNGLDAMPHGAMALEPGVVGSAGRFDGQVYLTVGSVTSGVQDILHQLAFTISVWVKPDEVSGRRPLIGKRFTETSVPFILSVGDGRLVYEGANANGKYEYNFASPPVMEAAAWQHLAAVVESGKRVTLYHNGRKVAEQAVTAPLCENPEPLVFGRDPWPGLNAKEKGPVFYHGLMDEAKFWARALSDGEIRQEYEKRG